MPACAQPPLQSLPAGWAMVPPRAPAISASHPPPPDPRSTDPAHSRSPRRTRAWPRRPPRRPRTPRSAPRALSCCGAWPPWRTARPRRRVGASPWRQNPPRRAPQASHPAPPAPASSVPACAGVCVCVCMVCAAPLQEKRGRAKRRARAAMDAGQRGACTVGGIRRSRRCPPPSCPAPTPPPTFLERMFWAVRAPAAAGPVVVVGLSSLAGSASASSLSSSSSSSDGETSRPSSASMSV